MKQAKALVLLGFLVTACHAAERTPPIAAETQTPSAAGSVPAARTDSVHETTTLIATTLDSGLDSTIAAWAPDSIAHPVENGREGREVLVLRNHRRMETGLHDVQFIGLIPTRHRPPYIVVEGRPCERECDEFGLEIDVEHPLNPSHDNTGYDAPGEGLGSIEDTVPPSSDRLFLGHCLAGMTRGLVWHAKHRLSSGAWETVVHLVDVPMDTLVVRDLPPPAPSIDETLALVRTGACREVP